MQHLALADRADAWAVLAGTERSQAALMTLAPGETSGERLASDHPEADQWLVVLAGEGVAEDGTVSIPLRAGSLLLVPAGEPHRIRATGPTPLRTLNVYAPPHYRD